MSPEAEQKEGTILFCDIRNFTTLFEEQPPIEAIKFANSVLAVLGKDIEKNGGVVDRFTGDGFLAHFGIKETDHDHIENACRAAISLRNVLQEINVQRYFKVESVVSFGLGLHAGSVAYGKIKTPQITQQTVLGDVVNTTARIESLTKFFALDILVSERIFREVGQVFNFQKMPPRKLKGKKESMQTYWLLPTNF